MKKSKLFFKEEDLIKTFLVLYNLIILYQIYILFFLNHLLPLHALQNILWIAAIAFALVITNLNYYLVFYCLILEVSQNYFNNNLLNERIFIIVKFCSYISILFLTIWFGRKIILPLPKKIANAIIIGVSIIMVIVTTIVILQRNKL